MFHKLNKLLINSIKNRIKNSECYKYFNFTYHTQKYCLTDILTEIVFIMRTGLPWHFVTKIKYKTVYKSFRRLCNFNIFKNTYIELLNTYIKRKPNKKLSMQYMDSTCITNKYGSECVGRNKYCKNKNITKISLITDSKGIPINVKINSGNNFDSEILCNQLNSFLIDKNYLDNYNNYILGDKGYCSNKLRTLLRDNNYNPIIPHNKRNTKDLSKLKTLSEKEKRILNNRVIIEHTFGKIKKISRRVDTRYDRLLSTYENFLYMSLIVLIKS